MNARPIIPVDYERFNDCVHCGLCLEACPTYLELGQEADSPRGRIHLMRAVADSRLPIDKDVSRHLDLCLGCRACESACPSGVRYGMLIEAAREPVARHASFVRRVLGGIMIRVLSSPRALGIALAPVRILDQWGARERVAAALPSSLGRLLRLLPPLGSPPSRPTPGAEARETRKGDAAAGTAERIGLLAGCVVPVLYPEVLAAAHRLLSAAGYRVVAPASGCCGALALHAGDPEAARSAARRTIAAFEAAGPLDRIVTTAAGCGAMMREYGHLLAGDPVHAQSAARWASRVADVSEVLLAAGDRLRLGPLPIRATYHDACHLAHGQGVRSAPRALLGRIPGFELVPLSESEVCCGSAGSYNLTEPAMADRLLARKTGFLLATGASLVVTGNPGCMLQMAAGLRAGGSSIPVRHTVEVLAEALARAPGD